MHLKSEVAVFEKLVRKGVLDKAEAQLFRILGRSVSSDYFAKLDMAALQLHATKLVTAFNTLLANPNYQIGGPAFQQYMTHKQTLVKFCDASKYGGTSHFWKVMGLKPGDQMQGAKAIKLLAALSINALPSGYLNALPKLGGAILANACLGFLAEEVWRTPASEERRTALLRLLSTSKGWTFGDVDPRLLQGAWMRCSYAECEDKHAVKKALNEVVRGAIVAQMGQLPPAVDRVRGKDRPTVVVVAESYSSWHAMHRCYGPSIRSLKERFRTILVVADGYHDPDLADLADEVVPFSFQMSDLGAFVSLIQGYGPDILYFPSVGMRLSSIVLANMKLAPIQIATNGHPATTMSDMVDYMVLVNEVFGSANCFSETVLLRNKSAHYVRHKKGVDTPPNIRENPDIVRIAVPAWSKKLSPAFVEACKQIVERASKPVEFHFFPNMTLGIDLMSLTHHLAQRLPAKVFATTDYPKYIRGLNACDIHLSTFPFGSANGVIDSARQGLPIVNLLGVEPHARIDANLANRFGQPDWLTAATVEDYVTAVVRLIDNDEERAAISKGVLASDPDAQCLVPEGYTTTDFAKMFEQVYRHHEDIQAKGAEVWGHDELMALGT